MITKNISTTFITYPTVFPGVAREWRYGKMTTVNLTDEGEEYLDDILETYDIEPAKNRVVEESLKRYKNHREVQSGKNNIHTNKEK